jgi:hypothetical protein
MKTNKLIYATPNEFLWRDAIREINSSRCSFLNANGIVICLHAAAAASRIARGRTQRSPQLIQGVKRNGRRGMQKMKQNERGMWLVGPECCGDTQLRLLPLTWNRSYLLGYETRNLNPFTLSCCENYTYVCLMHKKLHPYRNLYVSMKPSTRSNNTRAHSQMSL